MIKKGPRPRESALLRPAAPGILFLAAALAAPGSAFAQRIANQFDEGAANATQAPAAAGQFGPQGTATPRLVPHMPKAVSRPEGWPTSKDNRTKKSVDNHVLSSIRSNPGGPLEPITAADGSVDGGVVLANFEEAVADGTPPSAADAIPPQAHLLETAMVIARVGPEVVLEGDLLTPSALAWLAKVSPGLKPEQIRELKLQICRQVLPQHVESLIVYVDACRTIPEERLPEIEKKVNEAFDQQQLPRLIKDAGVAGALEYEQLLRSRGQSLDRIRKMFFERALAQQWIQQKVTSDEEIPHAEIIAWYQNRLADYDYPAKAKFEQFTVRIAPGQPREQAWNKLAAMGNDVLEGKPFADIARTRSEGATAATGGQYDWTTKGSLTSKVLDAAIFTLPVGQLSAIIEDGSALHIVRVTERTEAGRTPFIEAQVGIKEELLEERRKREMDEYLARLKERTPVWTVFDDKPAAATAAARREAISR
jgi:parvulin-like peptidyl-prolyl isomerase